MDVLIFDFNWTAVIAVAIIGLFTFILVFALLEGSDIRLASALTAVFIVVGICVPFFMTFIKDGQNNDAEEALERYYWVQISGSVPMDEGTSKTVKMYVGDNRFQEYCLVSVEDSTYSIECNSGELEQMS